MTAKEYLEQAEFMDSHINAMLEQIMSMRDLLTKTTSVMNDTPVTHTRNMHRSQEIIAKIVDMERELDEEIDRYMDLKAEISGCIASLEDSEERTAIELHYLCGKRWSAVAQEMGCSLRTVYRIHEEALKKICLPPKVGSC